MFSITATPLLSSKKPEKYKNFNRGSIFCSPPLYPLTLISPDVINKDMIRSFRCKETEKLFNGHFSKKLPQAIQLLALMKLKILNAAGRLETLLVPPSNHLELLDGNRAGQHSIRINKQWRICFKWQGTDAYEVEIVDYH